LPTTTLAAEAARWRRTLSYLFEGDDRHRRPAQYFNVILATLILANVTAVVLETVEPLRMHYERAFAAIERISTVVFAVEYLLRLWTSIDLQDPRFHHPLWGRLRYAVSFFAVVDLLSILPAFLGAFVLDDLRVLRLIRLLRMLKLTRHAGVFQLIWTVLREEARTTGALVFILCLTVTVSGSIMYMIEGEEKDTAFTSIPVAMWWAIETLTTVGYGDMIPSTAGGRLVGGVVIVAGIVTLALFSGLITVSFIDQLRLRRMQAANQTPAGAEGYRFCPHCGHALHEHS
jgi:voltage-gated potassium channel